MAKLEGYKLETGKLYAVGLGTKKIPVKTYYDVDADNWFIRFGDGPWNHVGDYCSQNPGVEIDEIDEQGNQVMTGLVPEAQSFDGHEIDVMPVVVAAEVPLAVVGNEAPAWME